MKTSFVLLIILFCSLVCFAQLEIEGISGTKSVSIYPKSDVDINIPQTKDKNAMVYALVIGNEDYKSQQADLNSEVNVDFAVNDAKIFKEYLVKTLGIPEENITLLLNATSGKMNQAISKLNKIAEVSNGKAELIFYYAGHGLPEESSKEPYIVPVDISGTSVHNGGIKLADLYHKLTQFPSKKVTVFMDACFSGGGRNAGLVSMRAVKIKPKENPIQGNLIVITSSSGDESSAPYKEKQHGLFTYYILKKLQESKGECTYKELSDFVSENVTLKSVLINNKSQTPQTLVSSEIQEKWAKLKFK